MGTLCHEFVYLSANNLPGMRNYRLYAGLGQNRTDPWYNVAVGTYQIGIPDLLALT